MRLIFATGHFRRLRLHAIVVASLVFGSTTYAQQLQFSFASPSPAELSAPQVAVVSGPVAARLEQARALASERQWDEVILIYRELVSDETDRVAEASEGRYLNLRDYCHLQISHLPQDALAIYRRQVDPLAEKWFQEGIERRDERLLRRIVDELFCSSWGDDGLLALGELSLEQADYPAARRYWLQISPLLRDPAGLPLWISLHDVDLNTYWLEIARRWDDRRQPPNWLAYPDSSLNLADVRARLILVSLRAGELDRAALELEAFRRWHPDVAGRLGGQDGLYAAALERLLTSAKGWRVRDRDAAWPTFAGSSTRSHASPPLPATLRPAWTHAIHLEHGAQQMQPAPPGPFGSDLLDENPRSQTTVRESQRPLSTFPLVVDGKVFFADAETIRAVDLLTGQPAVTESGVLYRTQAADKSPAQMGVNIGRPTVGVPRYTLTVVGGTLFGRVGRSATAPAEARDSAPADRLVGLDLTRDGLLAFRARPETAEWSFEGAPVSDGRRIFVAMRRIGVMPQAHVACFDAATGAELWRTSVGAADTLAAGNADEVTHNLLTLVGSRIYFNTNLGLVAALEADEGRIIWLHRYSRGGEQPLSSGVNLPLYLDRDPSPCLYHDGMLVVAPSDSPAVFALDADTGQRVWTNDASSDALHLLGVARYHLILSGHRLRALDIRSGDIKFTWPESERAGIRGMGRGVIAGEEVFWPTRNEIYILHAVTGQPTRRPISLDGVSDHGANLVAAQGHLIIAASDQLTALGPALPLRTGQLGDQSTVNPIRTSELELTTNR